MKDCPMTFNSTYAGAPSLTPCREANCAWWDDKKKQCAIITIAQKRMQGYFDVK